MLEITMEKLLTALGPVAMEEVSKRVAEYKSKPHGSKVKEGALQDCLIELVDGKACIVASANKILYLTSDTVESAEYVKQEEKLRHAKLRTYYYYNIVFKNGCRSYVRMRKKYRDAMLSHL